MQSLEHYTHTLYSQFLSFVYYQSYMGGKKGKQAYATQLLRTLTVGILSRH